MSTINEINIAAIIESLNKALDVDVAPILEQLNDNLNCNEISPSYFQNILCGECDQGLSKPPPSLPNAFEQFYSDVASSEEESSDNNDDLKVDAGHLKRSSEETMRDNAFARPGYSIFEGLICSKLCDKQCQSSLLQDDMYKEMKNFWGGNRDAVVRSLSDRRKYMLDKIKKSVTKLKQKDGSKEIVLQFTVGKAEICEAAYLRVVGLNSGLRSWTRLKQTILSLSRSDNDLNDVDIFEIDKMITRKKDPSEYKPSLKGEHAATFIKYFATFHASDSPNPKEENLRILPFETISQLFDEYNANCESCHEPKALRARKETFRKAWVKLYNAKLVRFTRGKGTFPTCDICNNCNDMLSLSKSSRKWTRRQRDVIFHFKSMHLKQQALERKALEERKKNACESYDSSDNPTHAVFFGDGMTKYASNTPKYGKRLSKKDTAFFENRVFGMEVYCGPIRGEILFHTDELVRGGANFGIEVHRQAMIQLSKMLAQRKLSMPPNIHFQLDNCGENKNKEFLTYCSILVELGIFEEITIGFLIVGHTHASIDQYFSCLRKRIRKAAFIASPLALHYLFSMEPTLSETTSLPFRAPIAQIQLSVIYDYKTALAPYHNKAIKNYGTPYQFKFSSMFTKCYMQYKQYTNKVLPWLPIKPFDVTDSLDILANQRTYEIIDGSSICDKNGRLAFAQHLGLPETIESSGSKHDQKHLDMLADMKSVIVDLERIELSGRKQQELRRIDEEDGFNHIRRYNDEPDNSPDPESMKAALSIQKSLLSTSSAKKGFIFMIDYMVNPSIETPMISTVKPLPINPWKMWQEGMNATLLEKQAAIEKNAIEVAELYDEEERLLDAADNELRERFNAKEIQDKVDEKVDDSSDCDDEEMFGEMLARKGQKIANEKAAEVRKKAEAKIKKTKKTDMLFIMHAVANIKAASMQMKKKMGKTAKDDALVSSTNREFDAMSYREIFHLKQVTPADLKYYNDRLTTDDILRRVDAEISTQPVFQWFPIEELSPKQRAAQNARMTDMVNDAVDVRRICDMFCTRQKEKAEGETVGRITLEVEAEKVRKAFEKETRAALQATAGPVVTTRAAGIDVNDICEVHLHTGQKKRCTRKAFLFISGLKVCRNVDCTSKFTLENKEAGAAGNSPATCEVDGCNNECYDFIEGKAYCVEHSATASLQKTTARPKPSQVRGKSNGKAKGKKSDDESDDDEDSDSSSSSSSSQSAKSSQPQLLRKAAPKRGLSPTIMAKENQTSKKRRPDGDKYLEECCATTDVEVRVLSIIRNNILHVDRILHERHDVARKGRRGADVDPFSEMLIERLAAWLTYSQYMEGMAEISSRLNLDVPEFVKGRLEAYVSSFVSKFVIWYTTDEGVVEEMEDDEEDLYDWNS